LLHRWPQQHHLQLKATHRYVRLGRLQTFLAARLPWRLEPRCAPERQPPGGGPSPCRLYRRSPGFAAACSAARRDRDFGSLHARQLGHSPTVLLDTYAHVIEAERHGTIDVQAQITKTRERKQCA
jgi:hypothetical protein